MSHAFEFGAKIAQTLAAASEPYSQFGARANLDTQKRQGNNAEEFLSGIGGVLPGAGRVAGGMVGGNIGRALGGGVGTAAGQQLRHMGAQANTAMGGRSPHNRIPLGVSGLLPGMYGNDGPIGLSNQPSPSAKAMGVQLENDRMRLNLPASSSVNDRISGAAPSATRPPMPGRPVNQFAPPPRGPAR